MVNPAPHSHVATREIAAEAMRGAKRQDLVQPYLSSPETGWGGLVAQAFHEPRKMESWRLPASRDIFLSLYQGGATQCEWRQVRAHQSWTEYTARAGDLGLRIGSNQPLEARWHSLSPVPTHRFQLHLSWDVFARTVEAVSGRDATQLTDTGHTILQDPLLREIALAVWRELEEGAPSGRLFADCTAQLLALHLLRHYTTRGHRPAVLSALHAPSARHPSHTLTTQQLQRVIACIADQPSQELTLEVLAAETGYSVTHFARLFRQTTGETPHQYVLRWRLKHAQHLLDVTDLPIRGVAAACGFADQSTFTRAFTRAFGVTPRVYRRERTV